MGLSRLAEQCRKCPFKDNCKNKRIEALGYDLDKAHIAKELGDVAWYLAVSAQALGFDLETILQMNVEKLKARYPHGFNAGHSQHRSSGDI